MFKMQNNNKNNISGILIYIKFSNKNIVGVTSFNTDWSLEKLCSVCTEATEKKNSSNQFHFLLQLASLPNFSCEVPYISHLVRPQLL